MTIGARARGHLAPLALLLFVAAAPEPAVIATLAPDADARWVSFTLTPSNQIRFTAMLDGRPVAAILDTGVSSSVLSQRLAARLSLRVRPAAEALAIGGTVASGWVDIGELGVGALTRRGGRAAVADLPLTATGGDRVDLLLGRDITEAYALDLDYDRQRFRLLPPGTMPFRGTTAPLRIAGSPPGYVTEIAIGARRIDRVMVDTGDGTALTLSRATWNALAGPRGPVTSTISYGLGGASVADFTLVQHVRSASVVTRQVETRIEPAGGYTDAVGMRARLGSGFLGGFRVLLDPVAGRMVLAPGRRFDLAPVRSTSGLLLRSEAGRLIVLHVMRGGPAAADGWREGDAICVVDGRPVAPGQALDWPVGDSGRAIRLTTCDGTTRSLTLRMFY